MVYFQGAATDVSKRATLQGGLWRGSHWAGHTQQPPKRAAAETHAWTGQNEDTCDNSVYLPFPHWPQYTPVTPRTQMPRAIKRRFSHHKAHRGWNCPHRCNQYLVWKQFLFNKSAEREVTQQKLCSDISRLENYFKTWQRHSMFYYSIAKPFSVVIVPQFVPLIWRWHWRTESADLMN